MSVIPFYPQFPPRTDPRSPSPLRFSEVRFRVFWLIAGASELGAICQKPFNEVLARAGIDQELRPLTDLHGNAFVGVQVGTYGRMASELPDYAALGYGTQTELVVQVPLVRWVGGVFPQPVEVVFLPIYLLVDNDLSLVGGREVFGYPKLWGGFTFPNGLLGDVAVEGTVIEKYGPHQPIARRTVLTVGPATRVASWPLPPAGGDAAPSVEELEADQARRLWPFGPIERTFGRDSRFKVDDRILSLMEQAAGTAVRSVALRQLRTPEGSALASYLSLVTFRVQVTAFHEAAVLQGAPLEVPTFPTSYASLPLRDALGLPSGGPLQPISETWYRADMRLDQAGVWVEECGAAAGAPARQKGVSAAGDSPAAAAPGEHWAACAQSWYEQWCAAAHAANAGVERWVEGWRHWQECLALQGRLWSACLTPGRSPRPAAGTERTARPGPGAASGKS
ncbi:MAG TPA: hypothetical protein VMV46_20970 [Thermoanaerobaculia bacterium]|nr:hypothetical protein [Thermoanaerobaculia bacterium]